MEQKLSLPTETIKLPSKGLIYEKENPLSSGEIEMSYMTAKHEDILTNRNYIQDGTVLDKLLKAMVVSKVDIDDLVVGDKNAILIAARVLGYGAEYSFKYKDQTLTVDLSQLENSLIDESLFKNKNEFHYTFPNSGTNITFKILTQKDEKLIEKEIAGLKKISANNSPELSTRLKYMILSVNGDYEKKTIREFVDNFLLAQDSRAFRNHIKTMQPDVLLKTTTDLGEEVEIPVGVSFFWPDSNL
jgi:hypothetical protein